MRAESGLDVKRERTRVGFMDISPPFHMVHGTEVLVFLENSIIKGMLKVPRKKPLLASEEAQGALFLNELCIVCADEPWDSSARIYMVGDPKNTVLARVKYRLYPIDFISS
ncbi:MAG: hypothetical protein JW883_08335 [Deltaproteobacteria bacterium]|nr:hypothetical protein [Deltaproteobacteria bacterium]